jgi:hypothetical protein
MSGGSTSAQDRRASPLERVIVRRILTYMRSRGAFAEKVHGDQLQSPLLDIIACYRGLFIHLEVKRSKKIKPTRRQEFIIQSVIDAGGIAASVSHIEEVMKILDEIDRRCELTR